MGWEDEFTKELGENYETIESTPLLLWGSLW